MRDDVSAAYAQASRFFVGAAAAVPPDAWDEPGLGTWSVRDLVAHANRAHTTIEDYLRHPRAPEAPDSPYFAPEAIAERGREAVRALGDDPVAALTAASEQVVALIDATDAEATLGSPAGTMTLAAFLPSRVAELVIHGLDVTRAIDVALPVPDAAMALALGFVAQRAATRDPTAVLLALTGRTTLPAGYSVY